MIFEVSSNSDLQKVLATVSPGDTISLAGGTYDSLNLQGYGGDFNFDPPLVIKSSNPEDPAVFTGLSLSHVDGITIESVIFDYDAAAGAYVKEHFAKILASSNIIIKDSEFVGDLAEGVDDISNGYATGVGLVMESSQSVQILDSEFSSFHTGAAFFRSDDVTISGNEIHSMRSDGFDFADMDNLLLENNHFHSFNAALESSDHRDFIQFWTTATDDPSENVTIRGNLLDIDSGDWTQSIFIRNEEVDNGRAGSEMYYQNFIIEENVIRNGHLHGITVGEIDGLIIRNNTVMDAQGGSSSGSEPTIRVSDSAVNVQIYDNIAHNILAPTGSAQHGNILLDVDDLDGLSAVFADPLDTEKPAIDALKIMSSEMDAGSSLLYKAENDSLDALISFETGEGLNQSAVTLSISDILDKTGTTDLSNIKSVVWTFGDGTQAEGLNVLHNFAVSGTYDIDAKVSLKSGNVIEASRQLDVDTAVIHLEQINSEAFQTSLKNTVGAEFLENGGAKLDGGAIEIEAQPSFIGNDAYTMAVSFKLEEGDTGGRFVHYTQSFHMQIQNDTLTVAVITDQGAKWHSVKVPVQTDSWHKVALSFSSTDGLATVFFDGHEIGRIEGMEGETQVGGLGQNLYLGSPDGSFDGSVKDAVFLAADVTPDVVDTIITENGDMSWLSIPGETPSTPVEIRSEPEQEEPTELPDTDGTPVDQNDSETQHDAQEVPITIPEVPVIDGSNTEVIEVHSVAELNVAIAAATGGETILLAAGDYGRISLRDVDLTTSPIKIASVDSANPATVSELFLNNVHGVTFSDLTIGDDQSGISATQISKSSDVFFSNILFDSPTAEKYSVGMLIKNSENVTIANSDFDGFGQALLSRDVSGLTVFENSFSNIARDALSFTDSEQVSLIGNVIGDLSADRNQTMIRFDGTKNSEALSDFVIVGNTLEADGLDGVRGITFRAENDELFQNIRVQENLFITSPLYAVITQNVELTYTSGNLVVPTGALQYDGLEHLADAFDDLRDVTDHTLTLQPDYSSNYDGYSSFEIEHGERAIDAWLDELSTTPYDDGGYVLI